MTEPQDDNPSDVYERPLERLSLPHRNGARMEISEPVRIGGDRPWICMVKLVCHASGEAAEGAEGEPTQTLLLRTGRGQSADEARRDALAQLALVYGSPVGPAPSLRISSIRPAPPAPSEAPSPALASKRPGEPGWLARLLRGSRAGHE